MTTTTTPTTTRERARLRRFLQISIDDYLGRYSRQDDEDLALKAVAEALRAFPESRAAALLLVEVFEFTRVRTRSTEQKVRQRRASRFFEINAKPRSARGTPSL